MNPIVKLLVKSISVLLLASILFFPVWGYNLIVDPYGIFRTDFLKQEIEPNQRFIKTRFLINNKDKYNSLIFGSSRVGNIDATSIKDFRVYNMTYSAGMPDEHLYDMKRLLNEGVNIKKIFVGVDNITYLYDNSDHPNQTMRKAYLEGLELWSFYGNYLTQFPKEDIRQQIKKEKPYRVFYDIYETGRPFVIGLDEFIEDNKEKHISDPKFNNASWQASYTPRTDKALNDILNLKTFCDENGVELIVFVNPMHQVTFLKQSFDAYSTFLKGLSEITNFYDFSGINDVTTNNYYYYETSHYRPIVGDMMVKRWNGEGDFGVYVTKDTIAERIKVLKTQMTLD